MTFTSYPAKGTSGMDISEWSAFFAGENGIINDYAGTSCALTRVDASNLAQIGAGKVRVGGYVLDITATHDLTVSTSAATYYIWACYDPALNVEVGGPGGAASAAGPCTLGISSGAPSTAGGKIYVLLYRIVRGASQALTAATVEDWRVWQGPLLHIPAATTFPTALTADPETAVVGFGPYPVGTRIVHGNGTEYTHIKSTSGLTWSGGWKSWTPVWTTGPTNVGSGGFNQGSYIQQGKMVHAEFRVQLGSSPTWGSGTTELVLPVPAFQWAGTGLQASVGSWIARNNSVPSHYTGTIGIHSSAATSVSFGGAWDNAAPRGRVDSNDPVPWVNGDIFSGSMDYRAA